MHEVERPDLEPGSVAVQALKTGTERSLTVFLALRADTAV